MARPAWKRSEHDKELEKQKLFEFGESLLADHIVTIKDENQGLGKEQAAFQIVDEFTGYRAVYPDTSRSKERNKLHLVHFLGDTQGKHLFSDDAKEISVAAAECGILAREGTPHRPTSRAKIEVQVNHKFWPLAITFWNTATNAVRRAADNTTA